VSCGRHCFLRRRQQLHRHWQLDSPGGKSTENSTADLGFLRHGPCPFVTLYHAGAVPSFAVEFSAAPSRLLTLWHDCFVWPQTRG
jgi:hypothetical protein